MKPNFVSLTLIEHIQKIDGAGTTPIPITWGNSDQNPDHENLNRQNSKVL